MGRRGVRERGNFEVASMCISKPIPLFFIYYYVRQKKKKNRTHSVNRILPFVFLLTIDKGRSISYILSDNVYTNIHYSKFASALIQ